MKTQFILYAMIGALAHGVVCAATITQTKDVAEHNPAGTYTLTFDQFDNTLGTLLSVTIASSLEWWGGFYAVDNESDLPSSGTATFAVSVDLSSAAVRGLPSNVAALSSGISQYFGLTANNGDSTSGFDVDEPGHDYGRIDGPAYADRAKVHESGAVDGDYISDYQGTGTFAIAYKSNQAQSWSGSGGNSTSSSPMSASGSVSITYEYEPVPEPSSFALLGLGGIVLALRRRKVAA